MKFRPHSYQKNAIEWIIDKKSAGLFLDLGMGKTVSTLMAIKELMFNYFEVSKVLIIAPLRVAENTWDSEIDKWDSLKDLKTSKVLGDSKRRREALSEKADIYIINRENVKWLVENIKWNFDMVVIDELSSFKSHKSSRFKALKKVRKNIKRIVGLTGTPAPNNLLDIWSQIYLLDLGERLGRTITGYRNNYFREDKRNGVMVFSWKVTDQGEKAIYEKIKDICISMKSIDYLELPKRIDNKIEVRLNKEDKKKYLELEKSFLLNIDDDDIVANTAGTLSNKLLQIANGAVYDENGQVIEIHKEKLKALKEIIEISNGKPILVFYNYKHDLERIRKYLGEEKVTVLKDSEEIVRWNKGEIEILLTHPASAGHGLNLQSGGNIIVWFGLTWSLELYQQANGRLYRQGQKENVVINHIITKGTIDEEVMRALENKKLGQDELIKAVKYRLRGR